MRLTYRPEIDGLRAIAILLVIFYHAELTIFEDNIFQSGFIGVDIFFIINLSSSFNFKFLYNL